MPTEEESVHEANPEAVISPVNPIGDPIHLPTDPIPPPTFPSSTPLSPSSPSVSTTSSSVSVTVPNTGGTLTFQLIVTDNLGVQSAPATATVTVQGAPIAVLTATPSVVSEGGAIDLSGAGSTSTGTLTNFAFSLVPPPNPVT